VKPAPFEYADPRSVAETLALLARHGDDAKVLAGGQSLVPMLNFRLARPAALVDLNRVAGLDRLQDDGGTLRVGALVRQRALERWAAGPAPLLAAGLGLIGHAAIRNRGTVAGSIAHADPAAELPALLLAVDGLVVARRQGGGERTIRAADFFRGPLATALEPDELVVETRWPLPAGDAGWGLHEVARRHGDFALAGAAAIVTRRRGAIAEVRIAVWGCGPVPQRATDGERALAGQSPGVRAIQEAGRAAAARLEPPDDLHATAGYRRRVAATLIARALTDAVARARDPA
jgi:carbon-monoxide dehydrogenase medium subunit